MAVSMYLCVRACMDVCIVCVCPVILWMSWKFITQVFTGRPSQKL